MSEASQASLLLLYGFESTTMRYVLYRWALSMCSRAPILRLRQHSGPTASLAVGLAISWGYPSEMLYDGSSLSCVHLHDGYPAGYHSLDLPYSAEDGSNSYTQVSMQNCLLNPNAVQYRAFLHVSPTCASAISLSSTSEHHFEFMLKVGKSSQEILTESS